LHLPAILSQRTAISPSAFWRRHILSGERFYIPISIERHSSLKQFWMARFFRLYPLYWFSLLAGVAYGALGLLPLPSGFSIHPLSITLANLIMFQNGGSVIGRPTETFAAASSRPVNRRQQKYRPCWTDAHNPPRLISSRRDRGGSRGGCGRQQG
jgi:hypothetical protein